MNDAWELGLLYGSSNYILGTYLGIPTLYARIPTLIMLRDELTHGHADIQDFQLQLYSCTAVLSCVL